METNTNVDELVDRWEAMRDHGTPPTIEELCCAHPELEPEVRRRIEALKAIDSVLATDVRQPNLAAAGLARRAAASDDLPEVLRATAVYRPRSHHGHGGLGVVVTAHEEELDRTVALKRIRPDRLREVARRRFVREAVLTARLQHPGIVPIYGLGQDDRGPFYTMPLIEGRTLQEAINAFHRPEPFEPDPGNRSLLLRALLQHFIAICNTVAYAHDQGVVHRDLKPSNLMLGPYGETLVMDWGLAKPFGTAEPASEADSELPSPSPSPEDITATGEVLGTPRYMSPEQARGEPAVPAGDIFSLGLILYAIVTGKSAFDESSLRGPDRLRAVRDAAIVPPRQRDPRLARALEAVCLKALAARAIDRYASARALADDVMKWLADEPVTAYPEPIALKARRWLRRRRTLVTSTAAVLVLSVLGLASFATVLAGKNAELVANNRELGRQRQRALAREELAIDAVKKFRDAVTANAGLKNQIELAPLRKALLREPLEFFRKLTDQLQADRGTRAEALAKLARAKIELAGTTAEIGSIPDAIRSYTEALAILEALARDHPTQSEYQSDLAASHNNIGNLSIATGDPAAALVSHQKALAIREMLVVGKPTVANYQRDLAYSHNNIGNLLHMAGDPAAALKAHRNALTIRERLAREHPAVTEYQKDLASSYDNLGTTLFLVGQPAEALKSCRQALEIVERLAHDHPGDIAFQSDRAKIHYNIGILAYNAGDPAEALQWHRKALEIREQLARDNPSVTQVQSELAEDCMNISFVLNATGHPAEALNWCRRALEICERLARDHPSVHSYQSSLGISLNNVAEFDMSEGRWRQALERLERAIASQRAALKAMPAHPVYPRALRAHMVKLVKVHGALNQPAEAIQMTRELAALAQDNPVDSYNVAAALALCVRLTRGEQQQALAAQSVQTLKQAIAAGWNDAAKASRDPDLAPLRGRDDFRRLLAELFDRRFPANPFVP